MKSWGKFAIAGGTGFFISFTIFVPETNYWHYTQWSSAWFQAIGSLLAVAVALLYPLYIRWNEIKQIEKVVEEELSETQFKVSEILRFYREGIPDHVGASAEQLAVAMSKTINIRLWIMYRDRLAIEKPSSYRLYKAINIHAEHIVAESINPHDATPFFQKKSAEEFDKKYKEMFS